MQIKNRIQPLKVLLPLLLGALTLVLSACGGAGGSKESPPRTTERRPSGGRRRPGDEHAAH